MKPWKHVGWPLIAGLAFAGAFAGCEEPAAGPAKGDAKVESGAPPPPPPLAKPAGEGTQPEAAGSRTPAVAASPGARTGPPGARPVTSPPAAPPVIGRPVPPPPRATAGPTASGSPAIRLSAGVALPQTGPTGILMSFSVDYRFTAGAPNPTSPYVWVIQRAKGTPARVPVRLGQQGNLPVLIPGWRPEQGPFQSHIEDASGDRLSPSITMR